MTCSRGRVWGFHEKGESMKSPPFWISNYWQGWISPGLEKINQSAYGVEFRVLPYTAARLWWQGRRVLILTISPLLWLSSDHIPHSFGLPPDLLQSICCGLGMRPWKEKKQLKIVPLFLLHAWPKTYYSCMQGEVLNAVIGVQAYRILAS